MGVRSVSVITAIRNTPIQLLEECISSLVRQRGNFEWLVVNDASSGIFEQSMLQSVANAAASFPVRLFHLASRAGLAKSRNLAFGEAIGEWIVVLDADDRIAEGGIELLEESRNTNYGFVIGDTLYFSSDRHAVRSKSVFDTLFRMFHKTLDDPYLWFDFFYQGLIARRSIVRRVGGYDEQFQVGEDLDLVIKVLECLEANDVLYLPACLYHYRENPNGVSELCWNAVRKNYERTFLQASNRRAGKFKSCRYAGTGLIGGTDVDMYRFVDPFGKVFSYPHLSTFRLSMRPR